MPNDPDVQELLGALRDTDAAQPNDGINLTQQSLTPEARAALYPSDRIPAPRPIPNMSARFADTRACGHTPEQHRHNDGQAADAASHDRALRELTADRDHWRRELDNLHEAYARATTEREQARNAVKTVTAERDGLRDDIQRVEQTRQEQVTELRQQLDAMTEAATDHRKTAGRALSDRDRYARTAANLLHQRNEATSQLELVHRDIARQINMLAADPDLLRDWLTTCQPLPTSYAELLQALAEKIGRDDQPNQWRHQPCGLITTLPTGDKPTGGWCSRCKNDLGTDSWVAVAPPLGSVSPHAQDDLADRLAAALAQIIQNPKTTNIAVAMSLLAEHAGRAKAGGAESEQALRDRIELAIRARLAAMFWPYAPDKEHLDRVAAVAAVAAVNELRQG